MHVGFTGTKRGMTRRQQDALRKLIANLYPDAFHHGDCVGADAEAHDIARLHFIPVHIHPPDDPALRALCTGADHVAHERPYMDRNHDIIECCAILIAAPRSSKEELRSGTWATVRYARAKNRRIYIINPLGDVTAENLGLHLNKV